MKKKFSKAIQLLQLYRSQARGRVEIKQTIRAPTTRPLKVKYACQKDFELDIPSHVTKLSQESVGGNANQTMPRPQIIKNFKDRLSILLYQLEKDKNYLLLEETYFLMSQGSTNDLHSFRDKLIKLQNQLSFYLQTTDPEEYTEYAFEMMGKLLRLTTSIINKKAL